MSTGKPKALADAAVEEVNFFVSGLVGSNENERTGRKLEGVHMKREINTLKFGLKRFAGRNDIRFYTGFPSYSALTSFYDFFLPSAKLGLR